MVQILGQLPATPAAVLDFGAGEGNLVAAFSACGIRAEGVEPYAAGRAAAARDHHVVLHTELPVDVPGRFELVTLLHSLEHVPDPVGALRQIRLLLASDGIVFIEVPHARSADMLFASQRRAILDLPVHLHHFTPRTLERVAAAAGFERVGLRLFNCTPLERALAARAARAHGDAGPPAAATAGKERGAGLRALWWRVLEATRRLAPGPTFQWIGRPC